MSWRGFPDGVRRLTADQLTEFHRRFEERIALEEQDPYRYGYVIPIWSTADQQFAALRKEFPEGVTELLILGGNRASKSRYLARRAVQIMVENPGARVWCLQSTEASSDPKPTTLHLGLSPRRMEARRVRQNAQRGRD
jgi:hypothetical protein